MTNGQGSAPNAEKAHSSDNPLHMVQDALERLRYGAIQLTVHDGKLVQIDVTERTRFQN